MSIVNNSTKRTLYFFKVETESGTCLKELLRKIHHDLDITRKYTDKDLGEEKIYLKDISEIDGYICGIISNLRLSKLPKKGRVGDLNDYTLSLLDDEGIIESTHFIYIPNDKMFVLEYNHFGPRNGTIQWHLNNKIHEFAGFSITEVNFLPILNQDTLDKIQNIGAIKSISFTVAKSANEVRHNEGSTFLQMTESAMNYGETGEVSIEIKAGKGVQNPILEDSTQLRRELENMGVDLSTVFSDFKVKAIHNALNKTKIFDLLQDKMKDVVSVVKLERERSVDSSDMFTQMQISYRDNRDELLRLATWEQI